MRSEKVVWMRTPGRIPELDGLRAMAVLMVIADHYFSWIPYSGARFGWLGVDLFFILSGFLITTILLGLRDKEEYFRTFYARRALRIFPPYYLCLAVYFTVSLAMGKPGTVGLWMQYVFYYTSLQVGQPSILHHPAVFNAGVAMGIAVLWSLSVEEIYYTVWAPVVRFFSMRGVWATVVGMIVVAPMLRWHFHTPEFPETYTFYCRMDGLGFGSLIALVHAREQQGDERMQRVALWMRSAWPVLLLLWLAVAIPAHADQASRVFNTFGISLADAFFASMVFAVIGSTGGSGIVARLLRMEWLRSIGKVSYTLYLVHYPIRVLTIWVFEEWMHTGLSRRMTALAESLVGIVVSLAIAYLSWNLMESRILRWKDRHVPSKAHVS